MGEREIVFIDANIFLEVILQDEKSENCKSFLEQVKKGKIFAFTSDFIVYTCLLQIQQKLKSVKDMQDFIIFIKELVNLEIIKPSLKGIYTATVISQKYRLDFDDSLVVSCMLNNGIKTLVSLDNDFDNISIITRKHP